MNEAKQLLDECKHLLQEIRSLVDSLKEVPNEEVAARIKRLPVEDKAAILKLLRQPVDHSKEYIS